MKGRSFADFRIIAKKYFRFGVFNHSTAKENFILEAIVNFAVVIHGLRGEKSNVRMEVADHIFCIPTNQNGRVFCGNLTACGVGENMIFRQKR